MDEIVETVDETVEVVEKRDKPLAVPSGTFDAAERIHAEFGKDWAHYTVNKADITRAGERIAARVQDQARPAHRSRRDITGDIFERMNAKADMLDARLGGLFTRNAADITEPAAGNRFFGDDETVHGDPGKSGGYKILSRRARRGLKVAVMLRGGGLAASVEAQLAQPP